MIEQKYLLITFDNEEIIISNNQNEALKNQPSDKEVILNGKKINTSNIAQIVEYKEDVEKELKTFTAPEKVTYTKSKQLRALESMLRGINKCVKEQNYPISAKQQVIKDKILRAIVNTKKLNDEDVGDFDIKSFMK
jgi:hypothetical protein